MNLRLILYCWTLVHVHSECMYCSQQERISCCDNSCQVGAIPCYTSIITGANHPLYNVVRFCDIWHQSWFYYDFVRRVVSYTESEMVKNRVPLTPNVCVEFIVVSNGERCLIAPELRRDYCRMLGLLEFHFRSRKSALVNSSCSWWRSSMPSSIEFALVKQSST